MTDAPAVKLARRISLSHLTCDQAVLPLCRALLACREALLHAEEWLDEQGCDCGVCEQGTCALCEARAASAQAEAVIGGSK